MPKLGDSLKSLYRGLFNRENLVTLGWVLFALWLFASMVWLGMQSFRFLGGGCGYGFSNLHLISIAYAATLTLAMSLVALGEILELTRYWARRTPKALARAGASLAAALIFALLTVTLLRC